VDLPSRRLKFAARRAGDSAALPCDQDDANLVNPNVERPAEVPREKPRANGFQNHHCEPAEKNEQRGNRCEHKLADCSKYGTLCLGTDRPSVSNYYGQLLTITVVCYEATVRSRPSGSLPSRS